ncbi:MAG: M15 family metallopeptidase [Bacteroidota bacterium]
MYKYFYFLFFLFALFAACTSKKQRPVIIKKNSATDTTNIAIQTKIDTTLKKTNDSVLPLRNYATDSILNLRFDYSTIALSSTERAMANAGLIDLLDLMPFVKIDLRYASKNNFVGEILYPDTKKCFLRIETIIKLLKAQQFLQREHPNYTFIIYDGARPQSVQYKMYEMAKSIGKARYVATPQKGGLHNYGVAIDLGLYDNATQTVVDMGTDFDFFGPEAQPRYHAQMLQESKLTPAQIDHRNVLKNAMKQAGFIAILSEWWHFEAFNKEYTRAHFPIIK